VHLTGPSAFRETATLQRERSLLSDFKQLQVSSSLINFGHFLTPFGKFAEAFDETQRLVKTFRVKEKTILDSSIELQLSEKFNSIRNHT
jgi:hypothetical protein